MMVGCCYYGVYFELKTSRTPTNLGWTFGVAKKYSFCYDCGFFQWIDANDSTCQEQYNINNPSTSLGQGIQERQTRHRRQERQGIQGSQSSIDITIIVIIVIWFLDLILKIYQFVLGFIW